MQSTIVSQVNEFLIWGSKLVRLLDKTEQTTLKLMYFVNRNNVEPTKVGHNFRK